MVKRITAIILLTIILVGSTLTVGASSNKYSIRTPYFRIGAGQALDVYTDSKMSGVGKPHLTFGTSFLAPFAEITLQIEDLTNNCAETVKISRGCVLYLEIDRRYRITDLSERLTTFLQYDWRITRTFRVSRIDIEE